MTHVATQNPGSLLDHFADVIEGGNAYNSGTSYYGIPGRYPADWGLRTGTDTPLSADAAGSTTVVQVANTYSWEETRWVKTRAPGFYLLCTAGADAAQQKARKISAWDNSTKQFTVDAFPTAPGATGEFTVLHGFKRLPNTVDIFDDENGVDGGYDRFFDVELDSGKRLDWGGDGYATYEGQLRVVLRLTKYGRLYDWKRSVIDNLTIITTTLNSPLSGQDHLDGAYARLLSPPDGTPDIRVDDAQKVVAAISMRLVYRVARGL